MKIRSIKANMTELTSGNGNVILFSYQTPVAACLADGSGFIRTEQHYSKTTSRHINQWLDGRNARVVPQTDIDALTK